MNIPTIEINKKLVDILEHEMMIKIAQAQGAQEAWRLAKLQLCNKNYRFKKGQKITVNYTNGAKHYIFEKIDWTWMNDLEPVIFAYEILKNGKLSKHGIDYIATKNGPITWDAMFVAPAE